MPKINSCINKESSCAYWADEDNLYIKDKIAICEFCIDMIDIDISNYEYLSIKEAIKKYKWINEAYEIELKIRNSYEHS